MRIYYQKIILGILFLLISISAFSQNVLKGSVCDKDGLPLIGAMVTTSTDATGVQYLETAITDNNGNFVINGTKGHYINVSYIGFLDAHVLVSDKLFYEISLKSDNLLLDEIVVLGYGTQKKANLSGSVATVDSKSISKKPILQASAALQGLVPGVTVTTHSGAPGDDGGVIRIRGINSFGGSSTAPLVLIDGMEGSMNSVDPSMIESISVLKDAASSSIYGSRAANGVILITTKRGSKEKFSLSYHGYVAWQQPTDLPDMVNALQFKQLTNAVDLQDGRTPTYDEKTMYLWEKNVGKDPDLYPDTDWQKAVLTGSGFMHNHTISLGVGTEKIKSLTTFGFANQDGIIENTGYRRYTFRHNSDVNFNKMLSMKLDMALNCGNKKKSPYQGVALNYMNTRPADIPNMFSSGLYNGQGMQGNNPIALLKQGGQNSTNSLNFTGSLTLTFKPLEWMTLEGTIAPKYTTSNAHDWKKPVRTYQDVDGTASLLSTPFATLKEASSRSFYGNYNFLMTLHHNFKESHDVKFIFGIERNTYDNHYLMGYRQVFNYDQYDQLDAGEIENMDNGGHRYQWAIQSFFGRLNYNYKERYLIEANLRIDGSSRFIKKNRWGYFPSVSAAWRISEEPFMKPYKHIVSGFKIRASYGSLGNQNLAGGGAASYYPTTQNLETGNISMNDNIYPLVTLTTLANPNIKWETTTMADVGVDLSLWSKFNITADWYQKYTDGILMKLDIPLGLGLAAPYQNAGKVSNMGWELGVSYFDNWGDFSFGIQANVSDVINKIVDMRGKSSTDDVLRNEEGHSIASIYALDCMGIIRTQEEADWVNSECPQFKEVVKVGDLRYRDVDNNGYIDDNDKDFIGSTIPRYTYSFNLNFGWKGIDLSVMFQGVGQADGFLNSYYVMPSAQGGSFRKEHLDYACDSNPNGVTPRLTSSNKNNWKNSSFWMRDASYLRLKNLQLGYTLPKKYSKKIGMQSLNIYVSGQNLFTATKFWKGYDPEVGYGGSSSGNYDVVSLGSANNYPQVRTFTLGLRIKF